MLKMRIDANIVLFLCVIGICLLRLIGEAIGWGNVLFKGMPFLWVSLSLGFLFTWQVVFKELEVYSVIFAWVQGSLNRLLQNIAGRRMSQVVTVSLKFLIPLSLLAWPIRDMAVRWNIVHHRWAASFPQYAQLLQHVAAVLYIVFIIIQGVYLVAVSTNTQAVLKYSHKEQTQRYVQNLLWVNFGLLMYDIIWIMTTLAIEGGGVQYLLKVLDLGCVGLVIYDACAILVLIKLQMVVTSEPADSTIKCDDPSRTITLLHYLVPVFVLLSIAREFNSIIFPSSLAMILPVFFLTLGSLVFVLKTYLLYSYLHTSLQLSTKEQPAYRISISNISMAVISIYSCLVNACQGYDSYQRWLSDKHPAFTSFLAVYCTIYTMHIAYEGFLIVWQMSYPGCKRVDSNRRHLDSTVLSACGESSLVFTVYQVLVVFCLPEAGMNLATLARLCGPVLFHLSTVIAYLHLKEKCYWSPKQEERCEDDADKKHIMVSHNQELKAPMTSRSNLQTPVPPTNSNHGLPVILWDFDYIPKLWQTASATMAKYALPALLLLAMLRWMLFGEVLAPFLPPWFMTRCYWYVYILVCGHWTLVMHQELHSLPVIKKCYFSMFRIVRRGDVCKYPLKLCLGITFLLVAALTVLNIFIRANHSAHEWGGQRTLVFQIMVVPLLAIHVYDILLQGLLLYGVITAPDSLTEATESSEVPVFAKNLPKLKHINFVLLLDHLIFMALDSSSVSAIYEYPLLIFHVGSFAVISILQCQGKELDKPKDEKNKPERNPSDPIAHCMLARWIPLQRTSVLMEALRPYPSSVHSYIFGAAVHRSFLKLWHRGSSMSSYAPALTLLLVPLAILRFMVFGEHFELFLPPWFITRCYWTAYILVCIHWLLVMHRELHSVNVIRKCYTSLFRIISRGDVCKYPFNLCLGIMFLLVVGLTVLNIVLRASYSAHEWGGQRTLVFQIMMIPLLAIHAYTILLQGLLLYGAITATESITEATENSEVPVFTQNLPELNCINLVLLIDHVIFMVLSRGNVSTLLECPLFIFHVGSYGVILILQNRGKKVDKPRDEKNDAKSNSSDPIAYSMLPRWISLPNPSLLMPLMVIAAVVRLAVKIYTFQGDWVFIVFFRLLASLTFAVVNYYIYKSLTKQLLQQHRLPWLNGIHTLILCVVVACCGIAEVCYTFQLQWATEGDGCLPLNISLTVIILMNVALIIHEVVLVIFLVLLDSKVSEECCNLKQALEWVLYLNIFYASFGVFNSFLAWLVIENESLIHLLGHVTCAILVPTMASPVLERVYNDINKDLQSNEIGTNQLKERGHNEQVCNDMPPLPEEYKKHLCRRAVK